jgi:hypothetical protein
MGATHSLGVLEIIHTDICGPFNVKSVDGFNSFITFTDNLYCYGYIYPICERSDALDKFNIFKVEVENQYNVKIKVVRLKSRRRILREAYSLWANSRTIC